MATLEKIRKRSVLLFTIIIVALLAFILGDFLTSGRTFFGHGTTIAKVGSAKADVQQLEAREKMITDRYQQAGQEGDPDQIRQTAIQSLLFEELLNKEYDAIGLTVSDAEISAGMTNPMPGSQTAQFIYYISQQLGLQAPSATAVYDAMQNPAKYGIDAQSAAQIRAMWASNEQELETNLKARKFSRMLSGLYTANDLDARSLYEATNTAATVSYAAQLFTDIPDDQIKVTDAEIEEAYNLHRARYRLPEETMAVEVIRVPIDPSGEDMKAAQSDVEEVVGQLLDGEGIPDAVLNNSKFIVERRNQPQRLIPNNGIIGWLNGNPSDTASKGRPQPGDVKLISRSMKQATVAKLMGVAQQTDSVTVSQIFARTPKEADSLMNVLNAGTETWASYIAKNPGIGAEQQQLALIGSQLPKMFADRILTAPIGETFVINDTLRQGGQAQPISCIMRVDARRPAVNVYDYAEVTYPISASPATVSRLNADLNKYAQTNNTAQKFKANAEKAGYQAMQLYVTPSSPSVGDYEGTRSLIKWASEAKAGQVSGIMQDRKQEAYYLVALDADYDAQYVPVTDPSVREGLVAEIRADKKAAKRIDALRGKAKTLEGYASLMKGHVMTSQSALTSYGLQGLGFNENELQGLIAGAKKGQLVGPVKGSTHAVVFRVDDVTTQGRPYSFDEAAQVFQRTTSGVIFDQNNIFNVLIGNDNFVNYSLDFEAAN